jgi:hypothetical protein
VELEATRARDEVEVVDALLGPAQRLSNQLAGENRGERAGQEESSEETMVHADNSSGYREKHDAVGLTAAALDRHITSGV